MTLPADFQVPEGEKCCSKCGEVKPLTEFHFRVRKDRGGKIVPYTHCKACHRVMTKNWNAGRKEQVAENSRRWRDGNYERALEQNRRWKLENAERNRAINQAWLERNRERKRMTRQAHYQRNRERQLMLSSLWYRRNKERKRMTDAEWRRSNPALARGIRERRWAREKSAPGSYTAADIAALLKMQRSRCAGCGRHIGRRYHVDHIVPLALGGSNYPENLQLLCPSCNTAKGAKHPARWAVDRGRLL